MGVGVVEVESALQRAAECAGRMEQDLNAADGRLGDGDTGITLRRVFDCLAMVEPDEAGGIGTYFKALAGAAADASGSSLGTLTAVALAASSRWAGERDTIEWSELGPLLAVVRDKMLARGGASLGDKTIIDALDAVAVAVDGVSDPAVVAHRALQAARTTLDVFRERPCRIGRARMFGERSIGQDDPGMLGFVGIVEAVAAPHDLGREGLQNP